MTINRVTHEAVRRDLDRLDAALGVVADGDRKRAEGLRRAYGNLRRELTHHHQQEDRLIWPALAKLDIDRELLAAMESEHQDLSTALAETDAAMEAFAASASAADARAARDSVVQTRAVVDRHLTHEEDELEPVMSPYLDSPEWKAVEKQLRSQPPSVAGGFFAWIQDGMSEEGRACLRSNVPRPVSVILSRVFGRRYHREIAPIWQS